MKGREALLPINFRENQDAIKKIADFFKYGGSDGTRTRGLMRDRHAL